MSDQNKIIAMIRRASIKWGPRYAAINKNRIERGKYSCDNCDHIGPRTGLQVDHIEPVIPVTGFDTWDGFIKRLFCDGKGLQLLCKACHKKKSAKENAERKKNRDKKKK